MEPQTEPTFGHANDHYPFAEHLHKHRIAMSEAQRKNATLAAQPNAVNMIASTRQSGHESLPHEMNDMNELKAPLSCIVKPSSENTAGSGDSSLTDPITIAENGVDAAKPPIDNNVYLHDRPSPKRHPEDLSDHSGTNSGHKEDGGWGWFDNDPCTRKNRGWIDEPSLPEEPIEIKPSPDAVTAPTYVLEESRSTQNLWKQTAGNRPPQPVEDRAYYEMIWAQNFARSQVKYDMPLEILTASSPISLSPFADSTFVDNENDADCTNYNLAAPFNTNITNRIGAAGKKDGGQDSADPTWVKTAEADAAEATLIHGILRSAGAGKQNYTSLKSLGPHHHHHTLVNKKVKGPGSGGDLTVLVRGDNVFGTTVSKSFAKKPDRALRSGNDTVSISIASYRVVESKKHGKYAQYLVIYTEGSFRDTVGVWKRYSDFATLSRKITATQQECSPLSITEDNDTELLPNALTSWRLLKKRQRWYRCLDAGYLSLKVFLLERFLHDILFESSDPEILRDFVGVDDVSQ